MERESENKRILKLLLEAYSIEEIKEIFQRIDNRTIDLMEFSSKDFTEINKILKTSYEKIKSLETNALDIFSLKSIEISQKALLDLIRTKKDLNIADEGFNEIRERAEILKQNIIQSDPLFNINIKNLRQNLTSLKLWVTNHKMELDQIEPNKHKTPEELNKRLSEIHGMLETIKKDYHLADKNISFFLDLLSVDFAYELDQKIEQQKCEPPTEIIDEIKSLLKANNDAISDIVTKLQYHDIVRQKVEHIQEIHNEIIQELDLIKAETENSNIHNKVKYFFQIRDISGLQASQLFHVNNDYQKAIKIITSRLLTISGNIEKISATCIKQAQMSESCPRKLGKIYKIYKQISDKWMNLDAEKAHTYIDETASHIRITNDMFYELRKFRAEIPDYVYPDLSNDTKLQAKDIVHSISRDIDECLSFSDLYSDYSIVVETIKDSFSKFINKVTSTPINQSLANQLSMRATEISTKLNETKSLSGSLSGTLNKVVDNIAYYEYFDQVIEQVIDELNTINITLMEEDVQLDSESKKKNLEFIKQKYTMQSEYDVHENVLNNNSIAEDEDNSDDNDVEFF